MSLMRGRRRLGLLVRARHRLRRRRLGLLTRFALPLWLGRFCRLCARCRLRAVRRLDAVCRRHGLRRPGSRVVRCLTRRRSMARVLRALWGGRDISHAGSQRRRWACESTNRRVGIRGMLRAYRRRGGGTADQQPEQDKLHDLDIPHVPAEKCCACMRSSLCSFATSAPFATNVIFAPPSISLNTAFEWTPIIPPA
jgi:hypothetical protein